jgi:hypothetical protein
MHPKYSKGIRDRPKKEIISGKQEYFLQTFRQALVLKIIMCNLNSWVYDWAMGNE